MVIYLTNVNYVQVMSYVLLYYQCNIYIINRIYILLKKNFFLLFLFWLGLPPEHEPEPKPEPDYCEALELALLYQS